MKTMNIAVQIPREFDASLVEWTMGRKAQWGEMTRVASSQTEAPGEGESAK